MENIDILMNEKKNLRDEILTIKRMIYSSLFSIITIFGVLCAYLIGKNGLDEFINNRYYVMYIVIISQIEFIVAVFILSLDSTLITISGYLSTIDYRINELRKKNLVLWESHRRVFNNSGKGAEFYCFILIYSFFALIFLGCIIVNILEFISGYNILYFGFLFIQFSELSAIVFIGFKKHGEYEIVKKSFLEEMKLEIIPKEQVNLGMQYKPEIKDISSSAKVNLT